MFTWRRGSGERLSSAYQISCSYGGIRPRQDSTMYAFLTLSLLHVQEPLGKKAFFSFWSYILHMFLSKKANWYSKDFKELKILLGFDVL